MLLYIPTIVCDKIDFITNSDIDYLNSTDKQRNKFKIELISLWYFIYTKQRECESTESLDWFTNIHKSDLVNFNIQLNKKRYTYLNLLNELINNDLIEVNESYSKGKFPKSYRVKTDFIKGKYTQVELDFNKIFSNFKEKRYWLRKYKDYEKIIKDTYDVKIDLDEYIYWLDSNISLELKPVMKKGVITSRVLDEERKYDYINDALKINYQNLWFKISDEGRFYNSTTSLSYTALPFIKLKRREIFEIDIKNCQPLLLSTLIDDDEYKKDVEDGIFYDKVGRYLNMSRSEFKVLSYKLIFFSNKELKSGKVYDALEELYPGLITQLNELRSKIEISKELQKIESSIIVDKIGQLDYKMMLRHDAVFVYEEDYDIVKSFIIREFSKLKLKVTIK